MAKYRLLADHVVNIAGGSLLQAGSIVTEGVEVPVGFIPTPYCDPLDQDGANKLFAAGVKLPGLIRSPWSYISAPTCRWIPNPNPTAPGNPYREYVLSGPLGVGLGFQQVGVVGTGQAP